MVSISSEVLREYREYERAMTTLVDAAVKPRLSAYVANIGARLAAYVGPTTGRASVPFYVMKSNGGVLSAEEVVHQPITTVLSGPAAGALGAALIAQVGGLRPGADLRRRRHVDRRLGGRRRRADADHRGLGRRLPEQDPDDRRGDGRRGRRLDRLAVAGGRAQGGPAVGGRRPGPALLRPAAAPTSPSPTHTSSSAGSRPTCSAVRSRSTSRPRVGASTRLAADLGLSPAPAAVGVLEISAWNQANALRQVTVKRGLDVRDFTLTTFGGSGSLLLCRLMDVLGIPTVLVPPDPGNVSAFGLLTVDVKNDYVLTRVCLDEHLEPGALRTAYADLTAQARDALLREGFAEDDHVFAAHRRPALLRPGLRGARAGARRRPRPDRPRRRGRDVPRRAPRALRLRLRRRRLPAGRVGQPPGLRDRTDHPPGDPPPGPIGGRGRRPGDRSRNHRRLARSASTPTRGTSTPRSCSAAGCAPGDTVEGPAVLEEYGSTVPLHPGFVATMDDFGNLLVRRTEAAR